MSLIRKHVAVLQAWACLDLVKVVVTVTTIFSKWNLQFFKQFSVSQYSNFTHTLQLYFSCYQKRSEA